MSGYIGTAPVPQATQTRESFTATASQTTFNTAGYSPGYVDVFLNGVKLAPADYTATNGSDIVLATGAAAGDILETVAYEIFQVADQDFTGDFSVDGSTFVVDSTNNRVGIGTSSPQSGLHVVKGTADVFRLERDATNDWRFQLTGGALAFRDATNDAERMRLDNSGQVIIGGSIIPTGVQGNRQLVLQGTGSEFIAYNPDNAIQLGDRVGAFLFANDDNNATEDHFAGMWAKSAGTTGAVDIHFAAGKVNYETDSPHMTLDFNGNLLVGTTSNIANVDQSSGEGIALSAGSYGGFIAATRSGSNPLELNRQSTDGDIAKFRKDGTVVGSIGAKSSNAYISGTTRGLHFTGTAGIIPCNETGAARDADTDLGTSSTRFKDLYLSGGVYLGGTGAANKLDDYEEGTWTPSFKDFSGTYLLQGGHYTKVGRTVTVSGQLYGNGGTNASGGFKVAGLPFPAESSGDTDYYPVLVNIERAARDVASLNYMPLITPSGTEIWFFYANGGTVGMTQMSWGTDLDSGSRFRFNFSYITSA